MSQNNLITGGHRGLGCTDNAFYQDIRDTANLPVENTVPSVRMAFKAGADYVEIDAVYSGDRISFVVHNVVPKDHFFGDDAPPEDERLNRIPFADFAKAKTGRYHNGDVARFDDMLNAIAECDPNTADWVVNIEIKGVQGSKQPYEDNDFLEAIAKAVTDSKLDPKRVLWSSFSLQNIARMSHLMPQSQYGMLFAEKKKPEEAYGPIYADHQDDFRYQYLQFEPQSVAKVNEIWNAEAKAGVKLSYMHPEILTIDETMLDLAAKEGWGINCWALFEKFDETRGDLYVNTINTAREKGVKFTVITDYLPEMKSLKL